MFLKPITFFSSSDPAVTTFNTRWKTDNAGTSNDDQITIPFQNGGTFNCRVYWGDGTFDDITTWNDAAWTHTYAGGAGTYDVIIVGAVGDIVFQNGKDKLKLLNISNWGPDAVVFGGYGTFYGCSNLTITAEDVPDLSSTTLFNEKFTNCSSLTSVPNMGLWVMSAMTTFSQCFKGCTLFNENIDDWDVSSATTIYYMFGNCDTFNSPLNSWVLTALTTAHLTFRNCAAFNQPLSNWDVSGVANFTQMFLWCDVFNQDLSTWDMSSATNITQMMQGNGFDQDISAWVMTALVTATNFMNNTTISTANYDALLDINTGWPSQALNDSVSIKFGSSTYTAAPSDAATGHDKLTDAPAAGFGWTVLDSGPV